MTPERKTEAVSEMLKEQLSKNKKAVFPVISGSMEPLIRIGDRVVIENVEMSLLIPGDIILYFNEKRYCTHRLVRIFIVENTTKIITKGDNLNSFDFPFDKEKYLGKVITIVGKDKEIDLNKKKYRLHNKILGKLLISHWFAIKAGQRYRRMLNIEPNKLTRLLTRISRLLFSLFKKSFEYVFIKARIVKHK